MTTLAATLFRRPVDRLEIAIVTVAPWIGPIVTLLGDDQERWAFLFWPLVYTAIGTYLAQPAAFLKRTSGGRWRSVAYNAKVSALFFLCLFEIVANCLAPPWQRFLIAAVLFLPYWLSSVVAVYAEIKMRPAKNDDEQIDDR